MSLKGNIKVENGENPFSSHQSQNKFVYINRSVMQNVNSSNNSIANGKILINPNFKQSVHVNPNFIKKTSTSQNSLSYANQHVNNEKCYQESVTSISTNYQIPSNVRQEDSKENLKQNSLPKLIKGAVIKNTKTKLVRVSSGSKDMDMKNKPKEILKKQLTKELVAQANTCRECSLSPNKKYNFLKTRFKIDKLPIKKKPTELMSDIRLSRSMKRRFYLFNTLTTHNVSIIKKKQINKKNVSKESIESPKSVVTTGQNKCGRKLITIRGRKYKLDSNKKTLICLSDNKKPSISRVLKIDVTTVFNKQRRNKGSMKTAIYKSTNNYITRNKMKKCNIPCPFFRKFGRCRGKEKGSCNRVHNVDQISLCPKFLQGACINEKCLLSHKLSPEKMPTCKFFLEGLCTRENCQYLHVKINAKADICIKFLEGFCDRGKECDKRHQYLCPEFEKNGKCLKRKCPYPHANVVRKNSSYYKIAPKSSQNKVRKIKTLKENEKELQKEVDVDKVFENSKKRYYIDSLRDLKSTESGSRSVNSYENKSEKSISLIERPKLGELPSFIPFTKSQ